MTSSLVLEEFIARLVSSTFLLFFGRRQGKGMCFLRNLFAVVEKAVFLSEPRDMVFAIV